jgi:hypothetical protein
MLEQLDNIIKSYWKVNGKIIVISLTLKDYWTIKSEATQQIGAPEIIHDIETYLGIPIYKSMELQESMVFAVVDGFMVFTRLNAR